MAGNKGLFGILQGAADSVISTVQDTVENVKTTVQDINVNCHDFGTKIRT